MLCKRCNTRIQDDESKCPNCGYVLGPGERRSPGDSASGKLSPSSVKPGGVGLESGEPAAGRAASPSPKRSGGSDEPKGERRAPVLEPPPAPEPEAASGSGLRALQPQPAELRVLLSEQLELLEPGLELVSSEQGEASGVGYATPVGEIDLLARDEDGGYVVVMLAEGESESLVAEVLARIGWVRRHLGKGKHGTRGIVLLPKPPENASYAAAAVADTVAFKTCRVALSIDPIDL